MQVTFLPDEPGVAHVTSETEEGSEYEVDLVTPSCSCRKFVMNGGKEPCKHIIIAAIEWQKRKKEGKN